MAILHDLPLPCLACYHTCFTSCTDDVGWCIGISHTCDRTVSHQEGLSGSLPLSHGTKLMPSGLFSSECEIPTGSSREGTLADDNARCTMLLSALCWKWWPSLLWQLRLWVARCYMLHIIIIISVVFILFYIFGLADT